MMGIIIINNPPTLSLSRSFSKRNQPIPRSTHCVLGWWPNLIGLSDGWIEWMVMIMMIIFGPVKTESACMQSWENEAGDNDPKNFVNACQWCLSKAVPSVAPAMPKPVSSHQASSSVPIPPQLLSFKQVFNLISFFFHNQLTKPTLINTTHHPNRLHTYGVNQYHAYRTHNI